MTKFIIVTCVCICYFALSCNSQNQTPGSYKYFNNVSKEKNKIIQNEIVDSIKVFIETKQEPFHPNENDSLTHIYIDTILYSPNNNKYASFIITKNSDDKLLNKGNADEYHYNAYLFIGKLKADFNVKDLTWVDAHSLVMYKSIKEASLRIREVYFKEITDRKNLANESTFKYNIDDVRFWDSPIWQKYYNK
jgi:hypothetical protein